MVFALSIVRKENGEWRVHLRLAVHSILLKWLNPNG
jgi:hypothetical protein